MNKSARYDVILFDLDGTLTDPKVGITRSIQHALSKLGMPEESEDRLVSFIGPSLFLSFQEHYSMDEDRARQAIEFYREYYSETGIYENSVYPGIPDLLKELRRAGKRIILATMKPTEFAEKVLGHFGLRGYFDHVVGPDLETQGLTKTEIIRKALTQLNDVPKKRIVMVGDRAHDIVGAQENGIDSIAVSYGYGTMEELQNAGPTHVANSVEDLSALPA